MSVLVIAEHNNKKLNGATLNTISAAKELDTQITVLVIGSQCQSVADEVASVAGVQSVWLVDAAAYEFQLPENCARLVAEVAHPFSGILAPATTFGKNMLPRIAALLDTVQVSDVVKIIDKETFAHPIYAGNAIETVKILSPVKVLTIRTTAFNADHDKQPPCCIERIDKIYTAERTQFIQNQLSVSSRPDLASAKIIVAGGRGLQSAEKFKLVDALADVLGAAVGASRAAVDAGFVANDHQVGQTGKVVAPNLYIALGISGAIQHLAGMKDSKIIVAINKDEDAPIMQIATYALIGDLFEIVPEMIKQLQQS